MNPEDWTRFSMKSKIPNTHADTFNAGLETLLKIMDSEKNTEYLMGEFSMNLVQTDSKEKFRIFITS